MKMRSMIMLAILVLVCASCEKKQDSSTSEPAGRSSPREASADPRQDYGKPYLGDDKMTKFIESMREERNPFEVVFKEGGQMRSPGEMKGRIEEFNAFARKYGFKDYEDYTAVWGRIVVGEMQIWGGEVKQSAVDMTEKSVRDAEEALKKPGVSPEMRKIYQEQTRVAGSRSKTSGNRSSRV